MESGSVVVQMGEAPSRFDHNLDRMRLISPEHGHYQNLAQLLDSRTPHVNVFSVRIFPSKTVHQLKDAIKKKNEPRLDQRGQGPSGT